AGFFNQCCVINPASSGNPVQAPDHRYVNRLLRLPNQIHVVVRSDVVATHLGKIAQRLTIAVDPLAEVVVEVIALSRDLLLEQRIHHERRSPRVFKRANPVDFVREWRRRRHNWILQRQPQIICRQIHGIIPPRSAWPFAYTIANGVRLLVRQVPADALPLPDRCSTEFCSDLPGKCIHAAVSLDPYCRAEAGSRLTPKDADQTCRAANSLTPPPASVARALWKCQSHARCNGCMRLSATDRDTLALPESPLASARRQRPSQPARRRRCRSA